MLKKLLIVAALVGASVPLSAAPANAIVCIEETNSCCEDVTVLKYTVVHIDCME
jgi:hypothetical protein